MMEGACMHVLLVEDNNDHAMIAERALTASNDWTVTRVATGQAALETVQSKSVDLVILDYQLPDSDGLAVLERLRSMRSTLPILFFTGQGDEEIALKALSLGAMDYVVKGPDVADRLQERVQAVVDSWTDVDLVVSLGEGEHRPARDPDR